MSSLTTFIIFNQSLIDIIQIEIFRLMDIFWEHNVRDLYLLFILSLQSF